MKLQFLSPLYEHPGPIASVFLDTSRDLGAGDPDRAVELRWRKLRASLLAHEADPPTVDAVAEALGTDRDREVAGRHGRGVFAAHGRVVLAARLPEPPAEDSARYGMLPDAMPLAFQRAPDIPYAAVVIHRLHGRGPGAGPGPDASPLPSPPPPHTPSPGLVTPRLPGGGPGPAPGPDGAGEELELEHETGRWPASRVSPGARSHRRIPVEGWPKEAEQLLAELVAGVEANGHEIVVVAGDPWAVNSLVRPAPRKLHGHFVKLKDGGPARPEPGRALLEEELAVLLDGRLSEHDRRELDAYLGQRARHREYVEGIAAAVAALQRGQAQALIVNRPAAPAEHLWVGAAPTHLALRGEDLHDFGLHYYWEEPAPGAALIRAAAGTQADLVVVSREELPLDDGVAVLLRYSPV
ncbi:hypothetical protein [Streptomyces sp. NPDC051211]|uniref:baeRF2 domain-containing protein n=1 Tax=Streptomyces sp. NPDC051211 TaxID=3154643 RepID=UPI00344CC516